MPGMSIGGMSGRVGGAGVLAAPGRKIGEPLPFRRTPLSDTHTAIWGVTRDDSGSIIPNCRVQLYRNQQNIFLLLSGPANLISITARFVTPTPYSEATVPAVSGTLPSIPGELVAETRSDANGNYIFWSPHVSGPFWLVAWADQDVGQYAGWSGASDKTIQPEFVAEPPF